MDFSTAHHIKGIRPALGIMQDLGFSAETCLQGTGIKKAQLELADQGISLQQELAFYRQALTLSKDPLLGLALGTAYRLESYGVLGYAILSAQTLGDALTIAAEFGSLSFTHFQIGFETQGENAIIHMSKIKPFDPDLLPLYADRDFSAIIFGTQTALGQKIPLKEVKLMQDGERHRKQYEAFYGAKVNFEQARMELIFDRQILSAKMPLRDPETSSYCRQQCQLLLNQLTKQSTLVDEVRRLLLAKPGYFPTIKEISVQLSMSERTLRRRLKDEGQAFQRILDEARQKLAKEYLNTRLSLDRIASLLGYTETANFSHAFKRWCGYSPTIYRQNEHVN